MIWDIDGQEVVVKIKDGGDVEVIQWEEDKRIISVPALLSREEAAWALRSIVRSASVLSDPVSSVDSLELFDKVWRLKREPHVPSPFIKGGIIYCKSGKNTLTSKQKEAVREALYRQRLMDRIGYWEERFNVLVPQINVRRITRYPFRLCSRGTYITFDKKLCDQSEELLDYCVCKAVLLFANSPGSERDAVLKKYFPSSAFLEKLIAYAYGTDIRH